LEKHGNSNSEHSELSSSTRRTRILKFTSAQIRGVRGVSPCIRADSLMHDPSVLTGEEGSEKRGQSKITDKTRKIPSQSVNNL
jgi:hypothetical protein